MLCSCCAEYVRFASEVTSEPPEKALSGADAEGEGEQQQQQQQQQQRGDGDEEEEDLDEEREGRDDAAHATEDGRPPLEGRVRGVVAGRHRGDGQVRKRPAPD